MTEREYTVQFTKSEQVSIDYFIDNMARNKAYRPGGPDAERRLAELKRRYMDYRRSWRSVPEEAIRRELAEDFYSSMKQPPMSIDIETAAFCDLACPHCYREYIVTPDKLISDELCYAVLDQAAALGTPSVKFNWRGEPLLHPNLPEFVAHAKEKGILETMINTNAVTLDEKKARALIEAGLDMMIYSFDGGTPETYNKIRVGRFRPNRFEEVYENIARMSRIRKELGSPFPRTRIQMVLTPDAEHEVDEFKRRFEPIVDDVLIKAYEERGWGLQTFTAEEQSDLKRRMGAKTGKEPAQISQTMVWKKPDGEFLYAAGRLPCQQPFQRLMVSYDGSVYMCCNDWGNEHPVGYMAASGWENGLKDYEAVAEKIAAGAKGFEKLQAAKMPQRYNAPERKVQTLAEIWGGAEINTVRRTHIDGLLETMAVCSKCTFRDTFRWEKL